MDIERLKRRKRQLGYTNEEVARRSGVPLGTVQKVLGNTTRNPRKETVLALARVLDPVMAMEMDSDGSELKETVFAYKTKAAKEQGEYTLDDYYAMPEDRRVELIDGVIYDMNAPSMAHQIVAGEVYHQLVECIEEHDMPCMPGIAPIDVQLDRDDRTMVQPDVLIAMDPDLNIGHCLFGTPEFIMEVLSPSTRSKDQILKLGKYKNAGCLEYWVADPENERVTVYYFRDETWPQIYSFDDQVPVRISDGLCAIDFARVKRKLQRLNDPREKQKRREAYDKWRAAHGLAPKRTGEDNAEIDHTQE